MPISDAGELELLELRARVHALVDELAIESFTLRAEMLASPRRAIAVLEHARRARGVRNRASFAIARWRSGASAPRAPRAPFTPLEPLDELDDHGPTLEALELAWHLEEQGSPVAGSLLRLFAAAIEQHGGMSVLYQSFGD